MPVVSVIMAAYNAQETILDSVDSILKQTYTDFELIVVNDGSTDKTKDIILKIHDPRIVLINQENKGPSAARNNGIRNSGGVYIAIMDSDDLSLPERLERQVHFLNDNPDYVLVGSNAMIIDNQSEYIYTSKLPVEWIDIKEVFPYSSFYHSSVMYRKDTYIQSGGYYDDLNISEDTVLWNKMQHFGKMANIEEALIKYRLQPSSLSIKTGTKAIAIDKIFKEIISEDKVSYSNKTKLLEIIKGLDVNERYFNYYFHLAKKYLFNNLQPKKARVNLINCIKLNPLKINSYIYFLSSILPGKILHSIYKKYKKKSML